MAKTASLKSWLKIDTEYEQFDFGTLRERYCGNRSSSHTPIRRGLLTPFFIKPKISYVETAFEKIEVPIRTIFTQTSTHINVNIAKISVHNHGRADAIEPALNILLLDEIRKVRRTSQISSIALAKQLKPRIKQICQTLEAKNIDRMYLDRDDLVSEIYSNLFENVNRIEQGNVTQFILGVAFEFDPENFYTATENLTALKLGTRYRIQIEARSEGFASHKASKVLTMDLKSWDKVNVVPS